MKYIATISIGLLAIGFSNLAFWAGGRDYVRGHTLEGLVLICALIFALTVAACVIIKLEEK